MSTALSRRAALGGMAAGSLARPALGQAAFPARPIRWVVGFPPGGSTDVVARFMADWLSRRLGQQVFVDNRPGATNNIGTDAVVRAEPDGYTLLLANPANAINATLFKKLQFNYLRDIAPVAGIIRSPNIMEVNLDVPAKSVAEFIAYAKANPGKINMASSGLGTSVHLSGELFRVMTGIDMVHVPYRGAGPAITDMIGGQAQVLFDNLPSSIEYVKANRLRGLAVTSAERSPQLPGIPTVGETVPGYEATAWFGIGAPRKTPPEIVDKLNREVNLAFDDEGMQKRLATLGGTAMRGSATDFGRHVSAETEKWKGVVEFAGLKVE